MAARRDDPRLLDAPRPDARRPVVPLQSWHRGGCDWSVIFSSGQKIVVLLLLTIALWVECRL